MQGVDRVRILANFNNFKTSTIYQRAVDRCASSLPPPPPPPPRAFDGRALGTPTTTRAPAPLCPSPCRYAHESQLSRRVNEWQERLGPVLEEQNARRPFDIHEYGSEVVNSVAAEKEAAGRRNSAAKGAKGGAAAAQEDAKTVSFLSVGIIVCSERRRRRRTPRRCASSRGVVAAAAAACRRWHPAPVSDSLSAGVYLAAAVPFDVRSHTRMVRAPGELRGSGGGAACL